MCEEYNLIDIGRIRNPTCTLFMHRKNTRSGIVHSRLDYFLISEGLSYAVKNTGIKPCFNSDDSLICIDMELSDQMEGQRFLEIQ